MSVTPIRRSNPDPQFFDPPPGYFDDQDEYAGPISTPIPEMKVSNAVSHDLARIDAVIAHSAVVDGASFVFDQPETVPAIWGEGDQVAWSKGESLFICGPQGVGKTTIAQQIGVLGRLGLVDQVLGIPIVPGKRKVLYLALDRPQQVARSLRRMVKDDDAEVLRDRLVVWRRPLAADIAQDQELLLRLCEEHDADTLIIDSLKDASIGLAKDEVGGGVNRALQAVIAGGVELLVLHHQRKAQGDGKPKAIADVFGSVWLTSGAGSVFVVWGEPGDSVVEMSHLKQPVETLGPWQLIHDHSVGKTTVLDQVDTWTVLQGAQHGISAQFLACRIYGKENPSTNEIEKARRKLDGLVKRGVATKAPGSKGGTSGGKASLYMPLPAAEQS